MRKLIVCAAVALVAAGIPLKATAASGPEGNKWKLTTVSWVKANENDLDKDDASVVLIGTVTEKHSDHVYFFKDDTGTINLDSDIALPVGKTIVVRGRVDQAFLHIGPLEINVDSWRPIGKLGEVLTK